MHRNTCTYTFIMLTHTRTQGNHTGLCDMRAEAKSGKCPPLAVDMTHEDCSA